MADARQTTLVSVRAKTCSQSKNTTLFARAHQTDLGKPWSFDVAEDSLTGAEQLLGLLVSDATSLFLTVCRQRRLIVDRVEATAKAELANTLRYLGVIGATGTPIYQNFQLRVYVDSPADATSLDDAWDEAVQRAPFLNLLKRGTEVEFSMQQTY